MPVVVSPVAPTRSIGWRTTVVAVLVLVLVLAACGSSAPEAAPNSTDPGTTTAGAGGPTGSVPVGEVAPRPSPACTKPDVTVATGTVEAEMLTTGDTKRAYRQWVPTSYDGHRPVPVVIDLHGLGEGLDLHMQTTRLTEFGEANGFVTLTPLGSGSTQFWNAVPTPTGPDDVKFISDLIDRTARHVCIDLARIHVAGYSNGALMASLLACRLSDRVASVAIVSGLAVPAGCAPTRPVSVIAFHGTADQFVLFDNPAGVIGPDGKGPLSQVEGGALDGLHLESIPDAFAGWASLDGCPNPPTSTAVSASVELRRADGCRDGAEVELYVIAGGGHTWPGSEMSAKLAAGFGPTTFDIDANQLMWAFFQAHPRSA